MNYSYKSIFVNYFTCIIIILFSLLLMNCGNNTQDSDSDGGNLKPNINSITIDSAGTLPVFAGMASSSVIYVHNNTYKKISGIQYVAFDSNNSDHTIDYASAKQCASIQPGQSCPISFTTAVPNNNDFKGSITIIAKYILNKQPMQFSQLINYAQVTDQNVHGVMFASGVNIIAISNAPSYGVVYAYGSGHNKIYNIKSLSVNKSGIIVSQGNIINTQLVSNAIQAIEVQVPELRNGTNNITVDLKILSYSIDKPGYLFTANQSNTITAPPINNGAILVAGNAPVINLSNTTTGSVQFYNAGNASATAVSVTAGSGLTISGNTCGTSIASYASCSISFSVSSASLASGSAPITVSYSGGSSPSVISTVSWYTYGGVLLGISASPSPFSFNASQTQTSTITVTNLGAVSISSLTVPSPTVVSGTGSISVNGTGNTCTGSLAVGATCSYVVTASAASATSGTFNLYISGNYFDTTGSSKVYSRTINVGYTAVAYAALLNISTIPTFVIEGNGVESQVKVITINNIGNAPAALSADAITNTTGYTTTLSGTSCVSPIAAGASCTTRSITFGPVTNATGQTIPVTGTSSTFAYNIPYSGGTQSLTTVTALLNASITPGTNVIISTFSATGSSSGTGASGSSYVFPGSSPAGQVVTITYKNTGTSAISMTGVSNTNNSFLWAIDTSNSTCYSSGIPAATLAVNATCTIIFKNIIAQNFMALGNIGAVYNMDLVLPQITYVTNPGGVQFQQTPTTPAGDTKIYANSTQATLTNTASVSNGVVTITNTFANNAGYTSVGITSVMEDYFTGTPTMTNCTQNTTTPGIRTQVCTLTSATSGSGVYNVASYVTSGTILNVNFALSATSPSGAVVSFSPLLATLTLNPPVVKYAYVTNNSANTVSQCAVNSSTGALSGCVNSGATGLNGPTGIAINNGYAYVIIAGSTISQCSINSSTGALSGCVNSGATGIIGPYTMKINNNYAYIANTNGGTSGVTVCNVSPTTGNLSGCVYSGTGLNNPWGIAINNGYAYISNYITSGSAGAVSQCVVSSSTGLLSSCQSISGVSTQYDIAINNNYIYIPSGSSITQCTINPSTGALSGCVNSGATGLSGIPWGIITDNNYLYWANNSSSLMKCTINPSTGALSGCVDSGATGLNGAYAIAIK